MKKHFLLSLNILIFLFTSVSCAGKQPEQNSSLKKTEIVIKTNGGEATLTAELAIKEEERNYGFMNREIIPDGTGMLFVFEKDQMLNFWMKNTPHPLSIAYITSSGTITDILDMTPYSLASVPSTRSVRFALEVPQGWFTKVGISVGDTVCLSNGNPLRSIK